MLRLILNSRVYDVAHETPLEPARPPVAPAAEPGPAQARGSAAGLQLQAARRLQPDRAPVRRRARARRHRGQRRQPRAGRRLRGPPSRPARAHRHAADDAGDQGRGGARARRRSGAGRRQLRRRQDTLRRARARDRARASCIRSTIRSSSPARARSATRSCATSSATSRRSSCRSAAADSSPASPATSRRCGRTIRVIGVEPYEADAMYQSLEAGRRVALDRVGIFADGVAVREVGELTFPIVQATRRGNRPGLERRDLRRDQGRLRRHAIDHGAGGRAGGGRPAVVGGAHGAAATRGSSRC